MQQNMQRTAQHMGEAQELLDELAAQDLQRAQIEPALAWLHVPCVNLDVLRELSVLRQKNLLRYWLAPLTLLPDTAHWVGWDSLRDAQVDAQPIWRLHNGALWRSQRRVYWLSDFWLHPPADLDLTVTGPGRYLLPGNGYLQIEGEVLQPLQVRYRQGAERFFIAGRGHRDLKRLLQEHAVPTFIRGRVPIVFLAEQPVALANMPSLSHPAVQGLRVTWESAVAAES